MVGKEKILILGLGYVGLPLALEFGKKYKTIGFDLSDEKIESYKNKYDPMGEVSSKQIEDAVHLTFSSSPESISEASSGWNPVPLNCPAELIKWFFNSFVS